MDTRRYMLTLGALLLVFGLSACASQSRPPAGEQPRAEPTAMTSGTGSELPTPIPGAVGDTPQTLDALADALRVSGAEVSEEGQVTQPFLSQPGTTLRVNGEAVQVFAYADEAAAQADAEALTDALAGRGTVMVSWVAPPHGYHAGRLLALYIGSNADTLQLLEAALGPELAPS
jgi:hypothetical protein